MNWPYPPTKLNQTSEFLENGPISETPRMRWLSNAKTSFEKLILVAVAKLILQVDYHRDFASGPWHSDGWSRTSWSQCRRAERCVYRTAALLDAGAAEDKGLVRRGGGDPPVTTCVASRFTQRTTHARPGVAETQCSGAEETWAPALNIRVVALQCNSSWRGDDDLGQLENTAGGLATRKVMVTMTIKGPATIVVAFVLLLFPVTLAEVLLAKDETLLTLSPSVDVIAFSNYTTNNPLDNLKDFPDTWHDQHEFSLSQNEAEGHNDQLAVWKLSEKSEAEV